MATILIYEPNHMLAQRLCDSLKKEKYNAIRCDETDLNPTALKEAGNCDVLAAPFSGKALKTCVAHLLGQSAPMADLSLDETERVALLDGRRVELTAQEYALLLALMETPDTPVSREQLLRTAWGYQSMGETRTVDVHVQRLRKKLGNDYIETVYKCGYRLRLA